MCGRYDIERLWQDYCKAAYFNWQDPPLPFENPFRTTSEVRPTDWMPIVRRNENGKLLPELRRWGFILMVDGKTIDKATGKAKKVKRTVINAMSEKLTSSYLWKWPFMERRCLVPMSSWDEWPEIGGGKQRVRASMPSEQVFMAAGRYDENVDPKTGEKMPVFTICTVPPNEFLGTVHDRAPMVLQPHQYDLRLDGGPDALSLVGTHPDATAFEVHPVSASLPLRPNWRQRAQRHHPSSTLNIRRESVVSEMRARTCRSSRIACCTPRICFRQSSGLLAVRPPHSKFSIASTTFLEP